MDFDADLAKQWHKNSWGGFEVSKNDFCLYFFLWCAFFFVPIYSFHAVQRHARHEAADKLIPNPKAETVSAYPRVRIRPRPRSPRTPTTKDYEDSPRPATATSYHDPITPTHAHCSAQGHGPAQGQWWHHWTRTQLWEL